MSADLYKTLGVERDADEEALEVAIERLTRQASALANAAPERSQQLREELRTAKERLLSGTEQRQRYDNELAAAERLAADRERAALAGGRPVYLLDDRLGDVVANAATLVRAGLYTAQASKLGSAFRQRTGELPAIRAPRPIDLPRPRAVPLPQPALPESAVGPTPPAAVHDVGLGARGIADRATERFEIAIQQPMTVDLDQAVETLMDDRDARPSMPDGDLEPTPAGRGGPQLANAGAVPVEDIGDPVENEETLAAQSSISSEARVRIGSWVVYGVAMTIAYLVLWQHLFTYALTGTSLSEADALLIAVPCVLPALLLIGVVLVGYRSMPLARRVSAVLATVITHASLGYLLISPTVSARFTFVQASWLIAGIAFATWFLVLAILTRPVWGILGGVAMGGLRAGAWLLGGSSFLSFINFIDSKAFRWFTVAYYCALVLTAIAFALRSNTTAVEDGIATADEEYERALDE